MDIAGKPGVSTVSLYPHEDQSWGISVVTDMPLGIVCFFGRVGAKREDNIKERTGLEWNILLRKAENREEWRKLVVKSTVVPQRSARLRDR